MKKIVLKTEACIGCGACVGIDSEHFDFSDDGFSIIKSQEHLDSPALNDAIDACPVAIISIEEMDENADECKKSANDEEYNMNECFCESNEIDCSCENCHCHEDKNKNAA